MVMHACNPITQKAGVGGPGVQGQSGLQEALPKQNNKTSMFEE